MYGLVKAFFERYEPVITPDRLSYFQRLGPDADNYCGVRSPDNEHIFGCTLRIGHGGPHVGHWNDGSALAAWDDYCDPGQRFKDRNLQGGGQVRLPLGDRVEYGDIDEYDLLPDAGHADFGWLKKP